MQPKPLVRRSEREAYLRAVAEDRARREFQTNVGRMSFPDAKRILDEALRAAGVEVRNV